MELMKVLISNPNTDRSQIMSWAESEEFSHLVFSHSPNIEILRELMEPELIRPILMWHLVHNPNVTHQMLVEAIRKVFFLCGQGPMYWEVKKIAEQNIKWAPEVGTSLRKLKEMQ